MGSPFHNPALEWFVSWLGEELVIGQVRICRREKAFELRHVEDWAKSAEQLKTRSPEEAREIAQFTEENVFRPLKSAPLRASMARVASPSSSISTKPNPRERPVSRSVMTCALATLPCC